MKRTGEWDSQCSWLQTQTDCVFRNSDVKPCLGEQRDGDPRAAEPCGAMGPGDALRALRGAGGTRLSSRRPGLGTAATPAGCRARHGAATRGTAKTPGAPSTTASNLTPYPTVKRCNFNSSRELTTNSERTNKWLFPTVHLEMSESSLDFSVENKL